MTKERTKGLEAAVWLEAPLDSTVRPLYLRIKHHIAELIANQSLKPDDKIPSENELVRVFGVARMTVNRALKELKNEGLLVPVAGVGTFVSSKKLSGPLVRITNIADDIKARGHAYECLVITNEEIHAKPSLAIRMGIKPGAEVFHTVLVHKEDGPPIQVEDRFVSKQIAPRYGAVNFQAMTPNEFLMQSFPLQKFEHRIQAILPSARVARLLQIEEDEPCIRILRRTWSNDRIVSTASLTHPSSRYELSDTFDYSEGRTQPGLR